MELVLERISKKVGSQQWLREMNLSLQSGAVTVLLGATQAGKTSLMRIMAGLDVPSTGRVLVDGKDVTGKFFKVRLGAPQNLGLIGDDFGTLQITGTMEADTTIVGAGKSQYFAMVLED